MKIKDRLKAAQKELAKLVAEPVFGEGADPTGVEVYGGVRIAELIYRAPDGQYSAYLRDDIMSGEHEELARLFLMCEAWLVYKTYGDEGDFAPDLSESIQGWRWKEP